MLQNIFALSCVKSNSRNVIIHVLRTTSDNVWEDNTLDCFLGKYVAVLRCLEPFFSFADRIIGFNTILILTI